MTTHSAGPITLGIDPGTATLGYGVIAGDTEPVAIDYGVIETSPDAAMAVRLRDIHAGVCELIERFHPTVVAVEQLFFARNVTTALTVGQARGVILLAAAQHDIVVTEYTPMQVKQAVVGYGAADKHQMQEMVRIILSLRSLPKPDDAADALAIALCHAQSAPFLARTGQA
ncbi:MAG: crossover junction endodeoxyribonuclease RuvC [Thermomicrobiales bacterium]